MPAQYVYPPCSITPTVSEPSLEAKPALSAVEQQAEIDHRAVTGRKTWKAIRNQGEAVWPYELELALIEGLKMYRPFFNTGFTKSVARFPQRNRFIADHIFRRTGRRRTPKQVGSRLQQLRETCHDHEILDLVCKRDFSGEHLSQQELSPSRVNTEWQSSYIPNSSSSPDIAWFSLDDGAVTPPSELCADSMPPTPHAPPNGLPYGPFSDPTTSQLRVTPPKIEFTEVCAKPLPRYPPSPSTCIPPATVAEDSALISSRTRSNPVQQVHLLINDAFVAMYPIPSIDAEISVATSHAPFLLRSVALSKLDPLLTFESTNGTMKREIFASKFSVFRGGTIVHSEHTTLSAVPALYGERCMSYIAQLVPSYWKYIHDSPDASEYVIRQEIRKDASSPGDNALVDPILVMEYIVIASNISRTVSPTQPSPQHSVMGTSALQLHPQMSQSSYQPTTQAPAPPLPDRYEWPYAPFDPVSPSPDTTEKYTIPHTHPADSQAPIYYPGPMLPPAGFANGGLQTAWRYDGQSIFVEPTCPPLNLFFPSF
ncbi:hypothetical protein HGRIS_004870 [Hohenbuehelia grisea]|uniref:TEA domain-containing protein n=1 Tax=Hohenbuehelia grisea TaxID=104357 RepID=A0ABR3JE32_9AGAR